MSIKSMAPLGIGASDELTLRGWVGQYFLPRRMAVPGPCEGWQLSDRTGHDDGVLRGRATTARDRIFRRSKRLTYRRARTSQPDLIAIGAAQKAQVPALVSRGSRTTTVSICGDTEELNGCLPLDGFSIEASPFVVGRLPEKWETAPEINVDLTLKDSRPYRMSRAHFAILETEDGFQVRDLESTLGTSVNGVFLGRDLGRDTISLHRGDNFITAGGVGSQFRFKLVL